MRPETRSLLILVTLLGSVSLSASANDLTQPAYSLPLPQKSLGDATLPVPAEALEIRELLAEDVDVWARIRKGFAIPDLENPLVKNQLNWYVARPDYIQRTTTRASRYLFHVVQELEKRNMPTELALLPFIESAFNPQAVSTAKAVGMWQFMAATGKDYDLRQSTFKDDRRDIVASTEAALSYLQRLYGMFGDWQLALAAYNWGEGSVQRALNKARAAGLPTDYNGLSAFMPAETKNYYPKLQAVKSIVAQPEQYGLTLPRVENAPYFVSVVKERDIDVKLAAQLAEMPLEEFRALNPQFTRPVIPGSKDTQILLPQSNAEKFKANLSKWGRALSTWTAHTVTAARERIDAIAKRFGTTPQVIREVNNIPPNMRLRAGSTIVVPKTEDTPEKGIAPDLIERATMAIEPDVPDFRKVTVRVGKKDTLASLAKRHNVTTEQIKDWNKLRADKVSPGQALTLQVPAKGRKGAAMAQAEAPAKASPRSPVSARAADTRIKTVARASTKVRDNAKPAAKRQAAAPQKSSGAHRQTASRTQQAKKNRNRG